MPHLSTLTSTQSVIQMWVALSSLPRRPGMTWRQVVTTKWPSLMVGLKWSPTLSVVLRGLCSQCGVSGRSRIPWHCSQSSACSCTSCCSKACSRTPCCPKACSHSNCGLQACLPLCASLCGSIILQPCCSHTTPHQSLQKTWKCQIQFNLKPTNRSFSLL